MTFAKLIVISLSLLVAAATSFEMPDWCQLAYDDCQLRFERHNSPPYFTLDAPDNTASNVQIVSRHAEERIGICNSHGIYPQFILPGYNVRPFNFFHGANYTMGQFKPFPMKYKIGSSIGHETFQNDRPDLGSCVRVYVTSYQLLQSDNPPSVANVNLSAEQAKRYKKCVVFRTT